MLNDDGEHRVGSRNDRWRKVMKLKQDRVF